MNKHREAPKHSISAVFIFLLLGIFALFSLVLILFSAQAYHNTVERTTGHNENRILSSYIRNNLRNADGRDCISYSVVNGIPALIIEDPEDNGEYVKYIYAADGMLRELYIETGKEINADAGEDICPAESINVQNEEGLMTVTVVNGGEEFITVFAARCGEGQA